TFLFIAISIPKNESYLYAFHRVVDTFIGTFVAVFWKFAIKSPLESKVEMIDDTEARIEEKEKEILRLQ
ncbi:hypothetical protein VBG88_14100, partial [Vagococcus fluvialis]